MFCSLLGFLAKDEATAKAAISQEARIPAPLCVGFTWYECALNSCLRTPLPAPHTLLPHLEKDGLQDPEDSSGIGHPSLEPSQIRGNWDFPNPRIGATLILQICLRLSLKVPYGISGR